MNPVIALCMPIHDQLYPLTFRCIQRLQIPRPYHLFDIRDHPVDAARNVLTDLALKVPEVTHLLWIDDDMVFDPDALDRLLAHDLPIVGGLCHNRRHPYNPILMRRPPDSATGPGYGYVYDYEAETDARGLIEVDATGGAFILVKREVYERIALGLKKDEGPYTKNEGGEDVTFCERAKSLGYSIFVDTTLDIGHVGEVVVNSDFARRNRDLYPFAWRSTWRTKPAETPAGAQEGASDPTPEAPDQVRQSGLRVRGDEVDVETRRHRARYAWAGRKLSTMLHVGDVLDYGCGAGYGCPIVTREALLRGSNLTVYGYDRDPKAVEFGLMRWWKGLTTDENAALGMAPAAVTCFEVIEHLDEKPAETIARLLEHAPIVIGSTPYMEPAGFNPHHKWSGLDTSILPSGAEVYGQRWDGNIGPLIDRETTPIMIFVVRR
jgi:hypothetical protein